MQQAGTVITITIIAQKLSASPRIAGGIILERRPIVPCQSYRPDFCWLIPRRHFLHDDTFRPFVLCAPTFDTRGDLVLFLLLLDFSFEVFLHKGHELVIEIFCGYGLVKTSDVHVQKDLPPVASKTTSPRQSGQWSCSALCITMRHRIQKTCPHRSRTGLYDRAKQMGHR